MEESGVGRTRRAVRAVPFVCPTCRTALTPLPEALRCSGCSTSYPIVDAIPRFVASDNYAASFGFQWNRHRKTQLDKCNGTTISRDRLFSQSRWTVADLEGRNVLEVGSGAGRFTQVLLDAGAVVHSLDYSNAVDANRINNGPSDNLVLVQASLYSPPFPDESFDFVVCLGVIQHTPSVRDSFRALIRPLRKGGRFCIDVYASPLSYAHPRHLLRPLARRLPKPMLYQGVERMVDVLLPISTALHRVPMIGQALARTIPVANWKHLPLRDPSMAHEWSVLDTFDRLSPEYEQPQRRATLEKWCKELALAHYEIERVRGLYVIRGTK